MRKTIIFFALIVCIVLSESSAYADWQALNPRVVGGTLAARYQAGMVPIGEGRVVLHGGYASGNYGMGDTWIFDINKSRWTKIDIQSSRRRDHGMAYVGWESALINGGTYYNSYLMYRNTTKLFDHSDDTIATLSLGGSSGLPGYGGTGYIARHQMCFIDQGKVLLFGGNYGGSNIFDNTWLYDSVQNEWQLKDSTIVISGSGFGARFNFGMAYIGDSKAVMFGGDNGSAYLNDTWVYDLAQNQWTDMTPTITGGTLTARRSVGMAYIGGDRVLLFGGTLTAGSNTREIWMYDLSDNEWTNLTESGSGVSPIARHSMGIAYAGIGQVLMFGGYSTAALNDTWRFSIPNNAQDTIIWEIRPGVLEISWSVPEDFAEVQFSLYRDGVQISSSVTPGPVVDGKIPFVYLDPGLAPNKIYRYQIRETYPAMNSKIDYPEISVPYCE